MCFSASQAMSFSTDQGGGVGRCWNARLEILFDDRIGMGKWRNAKVRPFAEAWVDFALRYLKKASDDYFVEDKPMTGLLIPHSWLFCWRLG